MEELKARRERVYAPRRPGIMSSLFGSFAVSRCRWPRNSECSSRGVEGHFMAMTVVGRRRAED
jgi:hypothetical protein